MKALLATAALVAALALAACGDDEGAEPAPQGAGAQQSPRQGTPKREASPADEREPAPPGTEIVVAESQYGGVLFDSEQRAIYLFDKEGSSESECYGACAEAWPPVLTEGKPRASDGADPELLGTTERDDGSTQVTYAGHPLYYYVDDPRGEVLCHNVSEFGGLWLVVEPDGDAVG